jgi:hypothetical protein
MILGCTDEGAIVDPNNAHFAYARNWASTHNATSVFCEHIATGYGGLSKYDNCTITKDNRTIRMLFIGADSQQPVSIIEDPK